MEGYKLRRWLAVGLALFWLGVGAMLLRADSPIGSTIQGGYKMCNFWASSDTLYTTENMTAYFAAGDPIKIWSPANGADPINGVISAENAAYMVLADTLSFLVDDTEAYFEHANRVTVNDPDGKTLSWVDASTGDTYVLDSSGNTIMYIDVSTGYIGVGADVPQSPFQIAGIMAITDTLKVLPSPTSSVADSAMFFTRTADGNPRIGMTDAAGNLMTITASGDSMYFEGASAFYFSVAPSNP